MDRSLFSPGIEQTQELADHKVGLNAYFIGMSPRKYIFSSQCFPARPVIYEQCLGSPFKYANSETLMMLCNECIPGP